MNTYIRPIFSNFYSQTNLDLNLNELEAYLRVVISKDCGRSISNHGGYQSNDLENNEYTYSLISRVNYCVNEVAKSVGILENKLKLKNFWINVNFKKDFNIPHTHNGSIISGVFYVKSPENCGNLVFKNPNDDVMRCYFRYLNLIGGNDYSFTEFTSELWEIVPEKNNLILFPSWLEHYVEPNQSDEERISIAFNYCS
jgi:uncharacterized protein (TIGR02466 family)